MPVCSRCGVDQPEDAFSDESHPLCEYCYQIELEEEAAGGEIGNEPDVDVIIEQEGVGQDMDQEAAEEGVVEEKKPRKPIPLSGAARILNMEGELIEDDDNEETVSLPDIGQLEKVVEAIEARGYSDGFGLDSTSVLRKRLQRVLFDEANAVVAWLTKPLIQALLEGPTSAAMSLRLTPLNMKESVMEGQTLLHWVVQWKLLQLQCGWRGHDDMVDLLIRAGAPVNATLDNGCTPLFFAVKYGSVDTVRLLINQGGADPLLKDFRKQTCLRNALAQASPYVLKYLLKHIPADETFVTELFDGSKIRINALDVLLTEFVTPNPDVSWATMGMPSVDDYAVCILLFLKKGIQISPHYPDVTYFLGEYLQGAIKAVKRSFYTRRIVDMMFGQWLPVSVKDEVARAEGINNKTEETDKLLPKGCCSLCQGFKKNSNRQDNTVGDNATPATTLYCGHSFCRDCILQHARSSTTLQCPTCSMPLSQDITQGQTLQSTNSSLDEQRHAKLSQLSLKQLQFECEARNLVIEEKERKDHCVQALVADWRDFTLQQGLDTADDPSSRLMAELSLSNSMISEDNYLWVAPSSGSAMIPIVVKGVPIFALLSTTSPYTMVSPRFVQEFGFEVDPGLQVTLNKPVKFVRAEDDDQKAGVQNPVNNNPNLAPAPPTPKIISAPQNHLVALRDFKFMLGRSGIEVKLPSAVQVYEPRTQDFPVGVVLGLDFFQSAAWTQLSVEVDLEVCLGRTMALLTGSSANPGLEFDLIEPRRANHVEEDLRYYSKDGKMFWTPIWHVSLSNYDCCLSLGQYLQQLLPYPNRRRAGIPKGDRLLKSKMTECAWCCREFPLVQGDRQKDIINWALSKPINSGMAECLLCGDSTAPTYYCGKKCRQRALATHGHCRHKGVDLSDLKTGGSWPSLKVCLLLASLLAFGVIVNSLMAAVTNEGPPPHQNHDFSHQMEDMESVGNEL